MVPFAAPHPLKAWQRFTGTNPTPMPGSKATCTGGRQGVAKRLARQIHHCSLRIDVNLPKDPIESKKLAKPQ